MARITLVPVDNIALIDGAVAQNVDYTGIDPDIHVVQWYDTVGQIEFVQDPMGIIPPTPNENITSLTPFDSFVTQAENIIYAQENPVTFWSLADGTIYEGLTYNLGQALVIYTYPQPTTPPTGFTDVQPIGSLSAYDTWQWNGTSWIAAPFPITYTLAQAQEYLTSLVNANGAALVNNQLRNYSLPELFAAADVNALLPADSVSNLYPTVGDYQVAVDAETAPLLADIAAATAVNQLYTFDPTVSEPAPYAP